MSARSKAVLRWAVAVGLLIGLLLWVESAFGWAEVLAAWRGLDAVDFAVVLALVAVGYLARAWRLGAHFGPPLRDRPGTSLRVMALHNAANNLLPARTGELSFPVLLSREFGIGAGRSLASLLWLRMLDLGALLGIGAASLGVLSWGATVGAALAVLAVFAPWPLWTLLRRGGRGEGRIDALRRRVQAGLPASGTMLAASVAWTFLHWGAKLLAYGWLLHVFADLPPGVAVLGAVAGELTSVLPVHGLAGAGTYEAGVLLVLRPLGVELERAVTGAVNLHLFLLVVSIVVAGLALVVPRGGSSLRS